MTSDLPFVMNTISSSTDEKEVEPTDDMASSKTIFPPSDERNRDDKIGDINRPHQSVEMLEHQVSFEHQQYEQWARFPVRRSLVPLQNKTVSIQQSKTRSVTRSDKSDISNVQVTKPHVLAEKSVLSRLKTCFNLKRDKTTLTEKSFPKKIFHKLKNPLALANATFLDLSDEEMISLKSQRDLKITAEYKAIREFHQETGLRMRREKHRDRCSIHISVRSQHCIDENILVRESSRSSDVQKLKKKKANQNSDFSISKLIDLNSKENKEDIPLLYLPRSKTHYSGLSPRKLPISRSVIKLSSAELFDFSKMEQFYSTPGVRQKSLDDRLAHNENKDLDLSMKGAHAVLYKSPLPIIKDSGG